MDILFEDKYLLIVNKAPGIPVAPDQTGDVTLLQSACEHADIEKPGAGVQIGLPHRIDRPTSGIVVFTKDQRTLVSMSAAFSAGRVGKTYWAAVDSSPPAEAGTLTHYISFDPKKNKAFARDAVPGSGSNDGAGTDTSGEREAQSNDTKQRGKRAVLHYRLIGRSDRFFLLEIRLETGRHHQIRAQLAKIGIHIKGDTKYGFPRTNPVPGIHLHARSVSFTHPVTRRKIELTAALPDDPVWKALSESAEPIGPEGRLSGQ